MRLKKLIKTTAVTLTLTLSLTSLVACGNINAQEEVSTQQATQVIQDRIVTKNDDGSTTVVKSDGTKATIKEDGTKIITNTDGSVTTVNTDGSAVINNADGTTTTVTTEGTATTTNSNGEVIKKEENVVVNTPDVDPTPIEIVVPANPTEAPTSAQIAENKPTQPINQPTQPTQAPTNAPVVTTCSHTYEETAWRYYETITYQGYEEGVSYKDVPFYAIFDYGSCPEVGTWLFVNRLEVPDITQTKWYQDGGSITISGEIFYPNVYYLDAADNSHSATDAAYNEFTIPLGKRRARGEISIQEAFCGWHFVFLTSDCISYRINYELKDISYESPTAEIKYRSICTKCGDTKWRYDLACKGIHRTPDLTPEWRLIE